MSTTPRRPATPTARRAIGASRASRYNRPTSFFERHRRLLLGLVAVVAVVGVAVFAYGAATAPAYACTTEWQPAVTPPPSPDATPRLGYVQPQMEKTHVSPGDFVRYGYCPPASGRHINAQGLGPIQARVFGPDNRILPQNWIHNLEHGGLALLYRCEGGDACTDEGQGALRAFFGSFPNSPICNIPAGNLSPVIAQFEEMAWPYAALVWGQVLPLQTLNTEEVLAFWQQQGERSNPEPRCAAPTPTPAPTGTPAPSPTTAPSASVAPSASPAASESPASS
ncbi:MAG: DUF3105 domain-containing protein [Chloroflexi bacterium]|nr:DUF3105 domain-containing protein [Chloroflexota bacterium]